MFIMYKPEARLLVVAGCSTMEDVKANIGELFQDFEHRDKDNKLKPGHEIQKFVADKDRRKARLNFSRKTTRLDNIKDTYHYLLKTSDPLVNDS